MEHLGTSSASTIDEDCTDEMLDEQAVLQSSGIPGPDEDLFAGLDNGIGMLPDEMLFEDLLDRPPRSLNDVVENLPGSTGQPDNVLTSALRSVNEDALRLNEELPSSPLDEKLLTEPYCEYLRENAWAARDYGFGDGGDGEHRMASFDDTVSG